MQLIERFWLSDVILPTDAFAVAPLLQFLKHLIHDSWNTEKNPQGVWLHHA